MKKLILTLTAVFAILTFSCNKEDEEKVLNGNYHKEDKEGLRMFLQKQSAVKDKKIANYWVWT